jgi:hypothetical protein
MSKIQGWGDSRFYWQYDMPPDGAYDQRYHTFYEVPEGYNAKVHIDTAALHLYCASFSQRWSIQFMIGEFICGVTYANPAASGEANSTGDASPPNKLGDYSLMAVGTDRISFMPNVFVGTTEMIDIFTPIAREEESMGGFAPQWLAGGGACHYMPREVWLQAGERIQFRFAVSNGPLNSDYLGVTLGGRAELFDQ